MEYAPPVHALADVLYLLQAQSCIWGLQHSAQDATALLNLHRQVLRSNCQLLLFSSQLGV